MRYEGRIRGARTCKEQLPVAADGESAPRFCVTCKRPTPPLTSHCDACGVCVAARDHHCGLFACCIGSRHPREFLVLLAATFVGIALTTADVVRAFCAERLPVIWAQLATPWREWTLSRGAAMLGDAAAAVLYVNMLAAIGLVAVICAVQQLAYAAYAAGVDWPCARAVYAACGQHDWGYREGTREGAVERRLLLHDTLESE